MPCARFLGGRGLNFLFFFFPGGGGNSPITKLPGGMVRLGID